MKILILGDTQLDESPGYDRLDTDGVSVRFKENLATLDGILASAASAGCEALVHLGDLSEMKNPSSLVLEGAAKFFRKALDSGMQVYALAGNHDGAFYSQSSSSFAAMAVAFGPKFRVAHTVQAWPELNAIALPYLHKASHEQIQASIGALLPAKASKTRPMLFMHYGAQGAAVGPKNLVLGGDALTADVLHADRLSRVFAGHYHKYQVVDLGSTKVYFPGSPYVCDMGERNDPKGWFIYDTETQKTEWHNSEAVTRRWVQVSYPEAFDGLTSPWEEGDIVKVVGTVPNKLEAEKAIRATAEEVKPFFLKTELLEAGARQTRGDSFAELSTHQAVDKLVADRCQDLSPEEVEKVKALMLSHLRDSGDVVFGTDVYLHSIAITNFMTYDELVYSFQNEPVLIGGENGLGKTNFSEAVLFALTGEVSKAIPKDNVIRQGMKKAQVFLTLRNPNGDTLHCSRSVTKNAKGATQTLDVTVREQGGAERAFDGGVREVQEALNTFLGMTFNSLRATNFLFQRDRDPLVFADPGDRKRVLGDVLNQAPLQKAAKALDKLRLTADRLVSDLGMRLVSETGMLQGMDIDAQKKVLAQSQAEVAEHAKQVDRAQQAVEDGLVKVEAAAALVRANEKVIGALPTPEVDLARVESRLTGETRTYETVKTTKLAELQQLKAQLAETEPMAEELPKVKTMRSKVEADIQALTLQGSEWVEEINRLTSQDLVLHNTDKELNLRQKELAAQKAGVACRACGTPMSAEHLAKESAGVEEELKSLFAQKQEMAEKLYLATGRLKDVNQKRGVLVAEAATLDQKTAQLQAKLDAVPRLTTSIEQVKVVGRKNKADYDTLSAELREEIARLEGEVKGLTQKKLELQAKLVDLRLNENEARTEVNVARGEVDKWEALRKAAEAHAATAEKGIAVATEFSAKVETTKSELALAEVDKRIHGRANDLMSAKGGLPVYLLDIQLPFLQSRTNEYMGRLGMSELAVSLETLSEDKETLLILVDNGGPSPLDLGAFSGGQLGRVEICLKQALADLLASSRGTKLQFLFYDEPTDGLDEKGKTALLDFLYERSGERFATTMVVSHDPKLLHAFHNRLTVIRKDNGATTLVEA